MKLIIFISAGRTYYLNILDIVQTVEANTYSSRYTTIETKNKTIKINDTTKNNFNKIIEDFINSENKLLKIKCNDIYIMIVKIHILN